MLKAKQAKIIHWMSKDLDIEPNRIGLDGSPTQVIEIFTPPPRKCGQIITGSKEEVVEKLAEVLKREI
jgi:electron transfer flavoprotein beta subunit